MSATCIFGKTKYGHGVDRISHSQGLKKSAWLGKVLESSFIRLCSPFYMSGKLSITVIN